MAAERFSYLPRATDSNNALLSGAKWKFYAHGTLTPQNVYADADLTTSLGSTVTADSSGLFVPIYFDTALSYRGRLEKSDGTLVTGYDVDPINTPPAGDEPFADLAKEPYASLIDDDDITAAVVAALLDSSRILLPIGTDWICGQVNVGSNAAIYGHGRNKTTITRKTGAAHMFYSTTATDTHFEGFTLDGAGAVDAIAGGGIWLQGTSSRPTITNCGFSNWYGDNAGSPAGAGIGLVNGSGARLSDNVFYRCFDGFAATGHTDGYDSGSIYNECRRFGGLIGTGSDRWTVMSPSGDGNSTNVAGAGYGIIQADDVAVIRPRMASSTLGHGVQFNGSARGKVYAATAIGNGISGVDFYNSPDGEVHGGTGDDNDVRGLEIDSGSNGVKVFGFAGSGNGDTDISIFRSADVELHGVTGDIRVWDAGSAASATIGAGGTGYTLNDVLTVQGGTANTRATFTATGVSGGVVTAVALLSAGEHWTLPTNPAATTGGTGTGCTLNVTWANANSDTCEGLTIDGGGVGSALSIISGSSSDVRLSEWRGTVSDTGLTILSSTGCDQYTVPATTLTLAASWVAYDSAWQAPAYFKDSEGMVHVIGTMKDGTTTAATVIGTLPAGFRPSKTVGPFMCFGAAGAVSLYVNANGEVTAQSTLNATRTSLDGIRFKAA